MKEPIVSLVERSRQSIHETRDRVEEELKRESDAAVRDFLNHVQTSVMDAPHNHMVAAGGRSDLTPVTLGEIIGLWTRYVDDVIMTAVRAAFMSAYQSIRYGVITKSSLDGLDEYMGRVHDRLVQGTHLGVTVSGEVFNSVRVAVAQGATEGWGRDKLAQRIAADLSWEQEGDYWRDVKAQASSRIDTILDAIGEPGAASREWARLHDPEVQSFRNDMNLATKHLDAEKSLWQNRALLIARTEATGANNFAGIRALVDEGVATKEWVATEDARTRETHRVADGQQAPVLGRFLVGTSSMIFPGDPTAPVGEVANCRCVLVGVDEGS